MWRGMLVFLLAFFLSVSGQAQAASLFKDVPETYWAYDEIEEMASKGIIQGYSDGTFRGYNPVTRSQSAIFIGRALNIETENRPRASFTDISPKTAGYEYIIALTDEGVFANGEKFNPHQPLTRAQLAKVLVEAFDLQGSGGKTFSDVPASSWAYPYVQVLTSTGITSGATATTFNPNGEVTRIQMAVFIKRALDVKAGVPVTPPKNSVADEILALVNQERAKAGAQPLQMDSELQKVAQLKSEDMIQNNYFDHTSPVYGTPFEMMDQFGISYSAAGENIAAGQRSAQEVMTAWMNSPGHRRNILEPAYTHIGIGIAENERGTPYYTQMFIKKR